MKCTLCSGELEEGFIPDIGAAQAWLAVWASGAPNEKNSLWDRMMSGGGLDLEGVDAKAIEAWRCKACGHLELFAKHAPPPSATLITSD